MKFLNSERIFQNTEAEMEDLLWSELGNFCANCKLGFDSNVPKTTVVNVLGTRNSLSSDINILDAVFYIYGLSRQDFAQIFPHRIDEANKYFSDTSEDIVTLCCGCQQVLKDVYDVHVKFNELSTEDSLLNRVIKFKRSQKLSPVKKEPEFIETQIENDDYFNSTWDSNNDGTVSDEENESFKERQIKFANDNDYSGDDGKSTEIIRSRKAKTTSGRPRGRPRKIPANEKLITAAKNSQNSSVKEEINSIIKSDGNGRLTRSKMLGSKLKRKTFQNYEEDIGTSSGSDFEETIVKKRKRSVKQKMILKKYRNKPIIEINSEELQSQVKQEQTDGEPIGDSNQQVDTEGGCKEEFTKIRPLNGKRLVYICSLCSKSFTRIKLFKVHMNAHKKEANKQKRSVRKKVKCPHCDKLCKNEDSLKIHESNHHSGAPIVCDKCGKTFMRMESLKLHQRYSHTEDKQFECKTCGMKYKWKGSLQSHELTHKNPRPHVCERCGLTFANKSNLNRHKTYHEDEEQDKELFRCQDCGKVLKNRKSLKKHINGTHREDLQKIFTCPTCGKTTKTRPNLRAHMKIHDPNRIMKRKSEVNRSVFRTEGETIIHPMESPPEENYQVPVPVPVPVLGPVTMPGGVWYHH